MTSCESDFTVASKLDSKSEHRKVPSDFTFSQVPGGTDLGHRHGDTSLLEERKGLQISLHEARVARTAPKMSFL